MLPRVKVLLVNIPDIKIFPLESTRTLTAYSLPSFPPYDWAHTTAPVEHKSFTRYTSRPPLLVSVVEPKVTAIEGKQE